jgi:putative oxidoreductase
MHDALLLSIMMCINLLKSGGSMIKPLLKKILQTVFGSALLLISINKIFTIFPLPEKQGFAKLFLDTMENSHYMMPMIVAIQLLAGLSLLSNRYVSLSLLALLPISINIFLFHFFHDAEAIVPACVILGWNLILITGRMQSYKPLISGI